MAGFVSGLVLHTLRRMVVLPAFALPMMRMRNRGQTRRISAASKAPCLSGGASLDDWASWFAVGMAGEKRRRLGERQRLLALPRSRIVVSFPRWARSSDPIPSQTKVSILQVHAQVYDSCRKMEVMCWIFPCPSVFFCFPFLRVNSDPNSYNDDCVFFPASPNAFPPVLYLTFLSPWPISSLLSFKLCRICSNYLFPFGFKISVCPNAIFKAFSTHYSPLKHNLSACRENLSTSTLPSSQFPLSEWAQYMPFSPDPSRLHHFQHVSYTLPPTLRDVT